MQIPYSPETHNLNPDPLHFVEQASPQEIQHPTKHFIKEMTMNDYMKRREPYRDFYGWASHGKDGILNIGTPGPKGDGLVDIPLTKDGRPGWFSTNEVAIYVTRYSHDGSIAEISIDIEDGLTYFDFDFQSEQGKSSPLGPKEYARNELVGKYVYEDDNRIMTDEDFEFEWSQFEEGIYGFNYEIERKTSNR